MGIVYRKIENEKEAQLASDLESKCLSTAWSKEQILNIPDYAIYVSAFEGDILCGIASMYAIAGEGQIMNLAVRDSYRRRGIANGLMNELILYALNKNCDIITLEVAEDNLSAISLYEKCGFVSVGKRNGFYNGKNALIMEKKL
ncbi:MAG: GNAT family N-acetyltransferase [Clostridia bacterium]|nr:GNAT family N-acetyltransferase [Clostridia bacterium]